MLFVLKKEIYCDDCCHALYTQIAAIKPVWVACTPFTDSIKPVSETCGTNFTDGQILFNAKKASLKSSSIRIGSASVAALSGTGCLATPISVQFFGTLCVSFALHLSLNLCCTLNLSVGGALMS